MAKFPEFNSYHFELIARELGEVVTGTQLDNIFKNCGINDTSGESTKWRRIHKTLMARQQADSCGNYVAAFIMTILSLGKFINAEDLYHIVRTACNKVLAFDGLQIGDNGKFRKVEAATTILEAEKRANIITAKLRGRDIHPEILCYSRAELMHENYFHAVSDAAKSIAQRIRDMTGLSLDGASLIDKAFAEGQPLVWINPLRTETDRSEHKGFALLLKGSFAAIRNPTAHEPKILWQGEDDAA